MNSKSINDPGSPDNFYRSNAKQFFNRTVNADMSDTREVFLKYVTSGKKVLDAGCGSGRDALAFKDAGFNVSAFDASPELVRMARDFTGLDVEQKLFSGVKEVDLYDGNAIKSKGCLFASLKKRGFEAVANIYDQT